MFCNDNFTDISTLLKDKYEFYAHLRDDVKETLYDHTSLCENYLKSIDRSKNLHGVFINIIKNLFGEISSQTQDLFLTMTVSTISFHDLGKINPNFQEAKMDNKINLSYRDDFNKLSSQHSIISAVLYIDYFADSVLALDKKQRNILMPFLFLNSYVISKHHGNMDDFYDFLEGFYEDSSNKASEVIEIFQNKNEDELSYDFKLTATKAVKMIKFIKKHFFDELDSDKSLIIYTYERLLYSILVACDYYATTEFMNEVKTAYFGDIKEINEFYDIYKKTTVYNLIRDYEKHEYEERSNFDKEKNINVLRNEMFLDAEKELDKNIDKDIFFLEAPTGSGKSNVSMNLSFKLMERDKNLSKIFYVYPYNTLVEQNIENIKKIFGEHKDVLNKITVINSISPIKMDFDLQQNNPEKYYQQALLDRQFLNYPFILTTHVSIFDTMFNCSKESIFGFHQFINSVIVLDEIQSYKNVIWTEIISFLKVYAKILNMKVIIMSATLPDLNVLTNSDLGTVNLIKNRDKYFGCHLFKNRVKISYDLLNKDANTEMLYEHVKKNCSLNKKILIEFIKKKSAYEFYNCLKEDEDISSVIELMTGDDNSVERKRIINRIKDKDVEDKGMILVATQVIEAGVDIDMDIGYKDISKLDSDEQFMGRINRSCKNDGIVYFFNLDDMKSIYKEDLRANKKFSLLEQSMRDILLSKEFSNYYTLILQAIKDNYNDTQNEDINLEKFLEKAGKLDFAAIEKRMRLIDDDDWSMSIYLCSDLELEDGTVISGIDTWRDYKKLLTSNDLDYAEKVIKLSEITSKMNYFIYQIKKNDNFTYNDKVGSLYCIYDGNQYFKNGKLDKEKFITGIGDFI